MTGYSQHFIVFLTLVVKDMIPANSNQRNTAGFRGSAAGAPEKPGNAAGLLNLSIELTVVVRTEFLGGIMKFCV
jgi:hypothetical protein